jgi:uncharacterized membrane protein
MTGSVESTMNQSLTQTSVAGETAHGGRIDRTAAFLTRHLLGLLVLALLVLTLLPFAAPLFLHWGWERPAAWLYTVYGVTCHQLPQRSWFLFGPKLTYTLDEIRAVWPAGSAAELRQFVGTPAVGWKVAWSDRMLSFYTMTAVWGAVYWLLRRAGMRVRPVGWGWVALLLAPLVVDGFSHLLNDVVAGMSGTGFRDTNAWLQMLTGYAWPGFYAGDQAGSFNWWVRLLTGVLAAWALAFAFFPRLERALAQEAGQAGRQEA